MSPSQIRLVLATEKQVNDRPSDFPADAPTDEQVADTLAGARIAAGMVDDSLGAAVARACFPRGRHRNFPQPVVGGPLAVAAADRPRHRAVRPDGADRDCGGAAVPLPPAQHVRRAAPPRSRQRTDASPRDRARRRACGWRTGSGLARAVARACRAGVARRQRPEGRNAAPTSTAVRSDRRARAGRAAGRARRSSPRRASA